MLATQLDHFRAVSYRDFQAPGKLLGTETTAQSLQAVLSGKADAAAVSVEAASEYLLSNYAGKLYLDEHVKGRRNWFYYRSACEVFGEGAESIYIISVTRLPGSFA